jgi:hypothetical protein
VTADGAGRRPWHRRFDPLLAVVLVVAGGVALVAVHRLRIGMYVVATGLAAAAVLRLVLRPRAAGSLVVRTRHVDFLVLALLAVGVAVLAAVTPLHALG